MVKILKFNEFKCKITYGYKAQMTENRKKKKYRSTKQKKDVDFLLVVKLYKYYLSHSQKIKSHFSFKFKATYVDEQCKKKLKQIIARFLK